MLKALCAFGLLCLALSAPPKPCPQKEADKQGHYRQPHPCPVWVGHHYECMIKEACRDKEAANEGAGTATRTSKAAGRRRGPDFGKDPPSATLKAIWEAVR